MERHSNRWTILKRRIVSALVFWGILRIFFYLYDQLLSDYLSMTGSLSLGISIACFGIMILLALLTTSFLVYPKER